MGILRLFQRLFGMGKNVAKTDVVDVTKTDVGEVSGKFDETTKPGEFKKQGDIIGPEGETQTKVYSYRPESFTETQMRQGVGSFSDDALRERYFDEGFDNTMSLEEFIIQERKITPEIRATELRDKGKIKPLEEMVETNQGPMTKKEFETLKAQDENPLLGGITAGRKVKLLDDSDPMLSIKLTGKEHPFIGALARSTGKGMEDIKQSIVDRMNEAYPPGDPKRTMIDDDAQIGAYIENQNIMNKEEFMADIMAEVGEASDDVVEAGRLAQSIGKNASPEELKQIRDMANESVKMLDEMGVDVSRVDLDLVNNTDDMMLIHQEMLKIKKLTDSLQGGAGALPPDQLKKIIDAVQAEANVDVRRAIQMAEEAMTPGEVDKAQKLLLEIRDALTESVRTGVYNSPFGRTKNAKGGRIKFFLGSTKVGSYLMKMFGKMGMEAPDKIADKKQIENIIRDPDTDLSRVKKDNPVLGTKATPENQMTIDEIRDMIQNDPRYDKLTAQQMDDVVRKETIRADLAYNLGVKPEDIADDVVEMLFMDGYDNRFGFANGGGVGSLFKRKVA